MGGSPPSTRFRHTIALIKAGIGTLLEDMVINAIGPSHKLADGELLFCFGGYNTIGEEFGADSQSVSHSSLLPMSEEWPVPSMSPLYALFTLVLIRLCF